MDRVKADMRVKRYSLRTEKTYCYGIRYFIRYHGVRPNKLKRDHATAAAHRDNVTTHQW